MPILKIDWDITKAHIHGTPWHFHTLYKTRWSEETNGYIQYIKHLLYLSVGSIQFSILSRTQDLDFLVTTALLSWIIQVFAEGTASLKTLDQEYTRTFKEQRKVCQKGTWVEQNGGEKRQLQAKCVFSATFNQILFFVEETPWAAYDLTCIIKLYTESSYKLAI